jgi:hypothetical protein
MVVELILVAALAIVLARPIALAAIFAVWALTTEYVKRPYK